MPTPRKVFTPVVSRPIVRATFNFAGTIPDDGKSPADLRLGAIQVVLEWMRKGGKMPQRLPPAASAGESFRVEAPGQTIDCVAIPSEGSWSLRLVHPDAPFKSRPAVAGRSWSTDIALRTTGKGLDVGVRILCSSLPYATEDISYSRPKVVVELAKRFGLEEVIPILPTPRSVRSADEVASLVRLLRNPARFLPVIVVSESPTKRLGSKGESYLIDPVGLAVAQHSYAHVFTVSQRASFELTKAIGRPWSVFQGAVRTYLPRLDFTSEAPHAHPLLLAERLMTFSHLDVDGERAVAQFLLEKSAAFSANRRVDWGSRLFIGDANTLAAEIARKNATDSGEALAHLNAEIESWKAKVKEAEELAEGYFEASRHLEVDRDFYRDANAALRAKINSLQLSLKAKSSGAPEVIEIPKTYDEMADWVRLNLAGSLVLHGRAFRGLKDAVYSDVSLVYRALLLLATDYRNSRMGLGEHEQFEAGLQGLGLKIEKSISATRAGEEGETYFVRYPTPQDSRRFLEWHLTKGTDRDSRNCLRVYFFWDEDEQQVVVGWLPSHLDTRIT